jgi:ComF family protein
MHDERGNRIEKLFWGRADVQFATAFLKMPKNGVVHHLIHRLKYHDYKNVGVYLGKLFARDLMLSSQMSDFDVIIPVPLHPKKLHSRGYNQCDCIAEGMNIIMENRVVSDNLVRKENTSTQTKKSRYARWKNVETIFTVLRPSELEGKSVLLIDDVITTGATIEACAAVLNAIPGLKLSVASVALPV